MGDISSPVSCIDDIDLNIVADFCDLFAQASVRFSGERPIVPSRLQQPQQTPLHLRVLLNLTGVRGQRRCTAGSVETVGTLCVDATSTISGCYKSVGDLQQIHPQYSGSDCLTTALQ